MLTTLLSQTDTAATTFSYGVASLLLLYPFVAVALAVVFLALAIGFVTQAHRARDLQERWDAERIAASRVIRLR